MRSKTPSVAEAAPKGLRAAQYVRMSTDLQKYSIENQAAAIATFAVQRNFEIVRTYADRGRSGLRIDGREELQKLIADVQQGDADFDVILVYDISRWGRFQDADESAHYEFICKEAGIRVFYCAEQFENDGSLVSAILKNMKRVMAGEYSRELSAKVTAAHSRGASKGFWQGGPAPYGTRRQLVNESGKPKFTLQPGQRKSLQTERVILVPGPAPELRIVRRIFKSFVNRKRTRMQIANELNAEGIVNGYGRPWSMQTIDNLLKNEKYIGNVVYGQGSVKLGQKRIENPRDKWVRNERAFKPIVSPILFEKAQKRIAEQLHIPTDQELLDRLKALWKKAGHLSHKIILSSDTVPHTATYYARFGSLVSAYERIGFKCSSQYDHAKVKKRIDSIIGAVTEDVVSNVERLGGSITYLPELQLLTINGTLTVTVSVATRICDTKSKTVRWQLRKQKFERADQALIIRMNREYDEIDGYYLIPTPNLALKQNYKLRVGSNVFSELYRHEDLSSFYRMWTRDRRQGKARRPSQTETSILAQKRGSLSS